MTIDAIEISWVLFVAACARTIGCVVMIPFGDALTVLPRTGFALALGILVYLCSPQDVEASLSISLLLGEFLRGVIVAAPLRVMAEAMEMCGELIDTARGQTIGSVQDPLQGQVSSDLATIMRIAAIVCAIRCGGLEVLIEGLTVGSNSSTPTIIGAIGTKTSAIGSSSFTAFLDRAMPPFIETVSAALRISAVWIVPFVLIDVMTALTARLSSGLSYSTTGSLLKGGVTYLILLAFVSAVVHGPEQWIAPFLSLH